ncbi:hypothetical protein D8Y23_05545 [Microbacterium enclense]|uniref:Uncharacterized protein n=1 Tax=Microbacterium enclense TaxID=993073 RepID=A0A3S3LXL1_9MICO|nr:hypothetical protein [Microbacterium enclense]RWR20563.1 hypothetical protein D8Y23_05545 [Microbacterium enclense]
MAIFILFLGVTAALNQIEVATFVTTPILIAVLAIIAGVIIVGAGGGLIKPMQQRWEAMLTKAEDEAPKIQQQVQGAPSVTDQAKQAASQVQSATRTQQQRPHCPRVPNPETTVPTPRPVASHRPYIQELPVFKLLRFLPLVLPLVMRFIRSRRGGGTTTRRP